MSAAPVSAPLPRRRGRPSLLDSLGEPHEVYSTGPLRRRVPIDHDADPARSAWIAKLISDPQAAKREALEERLRYWKRRLAQHEARLASIRAELDAARFPKRDIKPPQPEVTVWQLRVEYAATWADVQYAKARLAEAERELAGLAS